MNIILIATTLLLLALVAGYEVRNGSMAAQSKNSDQFIISVLRADGTLVPFAQYGNGGWWNPWPRPRQDAESIYSEKREAIPHSLGGLTEPWFKQCGKTPTTWYFWATADTPTVLKASKTAQVENHSQTNWALLTDFPGQPPKNNTCHCNIGVALSVNQRVESMIEVKGDSIESKEALSFVKQIFDEEEDAKFNRISTEGSSAPSNELSILGFPLSREERGKVMMSVKSLYRSKSDINGKHIYYFAVEKKYAGCNISLFQGWLEVDAQLGGEGMLDSHLSLTDCDMKGPTFTTPLGFMKLKDRTFLFVEEHGWEDESYTILELNHAGLRRVLETFGG
jgi:hypothetical protein